MTIAALIVVVCTAACTNKAEPRGEPRGRSGADQYQVLQTADRSDPVAFDQATLAQLKQAGGDLSKSTHVIHYLYFSNRKSAEAAQGGLGSKYPGSVDESVDGDKFRLSAEHNTVPSIENITAARQELEKVAAANGGKYDGWEAAITK